MRAATHEERPLLCPALTRRQGSFDRPKSQAIRIGFPRSSLAKAHTGFDRADRLHRKELFPRARARVEYLFQLYEQLTAPLLPKISKARARRSK